MTEPVMSPSGQRLEVDRGPASSVPEHAFHRARRHSRRVRVLKLALPAAALTMAAVFAGYSYVSANVDFAFDLDGASFADGKLVMANPKLDGFTKESLPYSITAARAIQDLTDQSLIELEDIRGVLPLNTENSATVEAARGLFDRDKNTIDITSEFMIATTDGLKARFQSAFVDIDEGDLTTKDPIAIEAKGLQISADALSVTEKGKVLVFSRQVRVTIEPKQDKTAQKAQGD